MAVLGATSLTGCTAIPDFIAAGTLGLFRQTSAPTSWTKQTTHNDKMLRVVSGTASSGGSTAFSSVFTSSRALPGSVTGSHQGGGIAQTTLNEGEMPQHNHVYMNPANGNFRGLKYDGTGNAMEYPNFVNGNMSSSGSYQQHNHGWQQMGWTGNFSGTALNFDVKFVDVIIASKN